jgi:hypothetical protein
MSAAQAEYRLQTTYDPSRRRQARRTGRERGCWVYIPGVELTAAGFDPLASPPFYRTHGFQRSRNAGSVIVSLYREP